MNSLGTAPMFRSIPVLSSDATKSVIVEMAAIALSSVPGRSCMELISLRPVPSAWIELDIGSMIPEMNPPNSDPIARPIVSIIF